jgi:hypothetical protein
VNIRVHVCVSVSLLVAALVACRPTSGPQATLDRYATALRKHDYGSAYDLLSAEYRSKVSREEFVKAMKDSPREVDDTANKLRSNVTSVEVAAEFSYGLGDSLRMVQEDGRWKIASDALNYYDQASPRNTLRAFVRAYQLQRWDIMLRFVPSAYASKMDAEKMKAQFTGPSKDQIEGLLSLLAANSNEPISENGNNALLTYGVDGEVTFVREDGVWKIKDLD